MNNKSIFAIVIVLLAIMSLLFVYSMDETDDSSNKTAI